MNHLLLQALRCERTVRPPVWLMRQAGRYMPQYRELRTKHSLWEMFHNPELAAAVTRLPIDLLGVDAAILFSDILVIAESLGLTVHFPDKGGPRVEPLIQTQAQIAALPYLPVEDTLAYVFETIKLVKQSISIPLIGFCGGPFTVASYLAGDVKKDPQLLAKITEASIAYLQAQVKAGVDAIQIFDSWANLLNDEEFSTLCLPYLKQMVDAVKGVPVIVFCRDSSLRAEPLASLAPSCISFDWHRPMKTLRSIVPASIAVQGNFNPEFLKLSPSEITRGVKELLAEMQGEKGFIVNLGHGVTPDIPMENVRAFVEAVTTL